MIALLIQLMLLPFYIMLWCMMLMGKLLKFLFWGLIIILGFMVA